MYVWQLLMQFLSLEGIRCYRNKIMKKNVVKKLFLILCMCFVAMLSAQAQHILKGTIYDESALGIPSATLRVLTRDSIFVKGGTTDDGGAFFFKDIKAGEYILALSTIGYVNQFVDFKMPDKAYTLPLITLKTDNVLLNEVEVRGSSVIHKKDHLLIIPDKQQIKHAFSGYDLLYNLMIPGLRVNRKTGTVEAVTGTATIYINGVKADFREVQNLRPKDIEKVEYYSMPTGKYVRDAAAINYITKTYKTGGYITLDGEQTIGYLHGNYNVGTKVSHNNTSYTFFGGHTMQAYDGVEKEQSEELFFSDYMVKRNRTNGDADFSNNQQYAQFKVNNSTKKRNLSAQLFLVRNATPHNDRGELLNYIGYDERGIQSFDKSEDESLKPAISLNGVFNITETQQLEVEANGAYTRNTYGRIYTEGEQHSSTHADEDLYSFDAQSQYTFRPNSKNTLYASLRHFHNITSSLYTGDYNSWQHLWKGETLLMVDYVHDFGEKVTLALNPGCSLLNYKLHGNDLQRFWTFRTNTWIRYLFNSRHWIGVGFSLGNFQPEINTLNSLDQTIDFYQVKRGNPNLENTKVYNWYLTYEGQIKLFNIQIRLWDMKYGNNICSDYYLQGDKLISSYRSDGSFNTVNSDLSVSCRILENLRANFTFKYEHMYVPGESNLSQNNFGASLDVNYFLKSFAFNVYGKTPEKTLDRNSLAFLKTPASYGLSVRYNRKNFMAEIGTENPFTKQVHYREYADYGVYKYYQVQTSRIYQQTAYIKLAYTFDFGKKTSRESNNVDRSINSAILKAE